MSDLFGNPVSAEAEPDTTIRLTPALRRVLEKALECGTLRRAGGYVDGETNSTMALSQHFPEFEQPVAVDRCIAAGWLAPGVAYNTYVPTSAAEEAIRADDRRVAKEIADRMAARAARKAERALAKAAA